MGYFVVLPSLPAHCQRGRCGTAMLLLGVLVQGPRRCGVSVPRRCPAPGSEGTVGCTGQTQCLPTRLPPSWTPECPQHLRRRLARGKLEEKLKWREARASTSTGGTAFLSCVLGTHSVQGWGGFLEPHQLPRKWVSSLEPEQVRCGDVGATGVGVTSDLAKGSSLDTGARAEPSRPTHPLASPCNLG